MQIFRALCLCVLALAAIPAIAAILPAAPAPQADTQPVAALRALITRCLPSVLAGGALPAAGLAPAPEALARQILADRPGAVWTDPAGRLVLVRFADVPVCRVLAPGIDPAVLGDLVIRVFREADTPFQRRRFGLQVDGGFAAVFAMAQPQATVVVRVSALRDGAGAFLATLSVERDAPGG